MDSVENFIDKLKNILPDICTPHHLVEAGIYTSLQAAYNGRKKGTGPSFLQLPNRGVLYPKECVIEYLRKAKRIRRIL